MKSSITLQFQKAVTIAGNTAFATVEIEHGTNIKGQQYQEIIMRTTGNQAIDDIRNQFENFEMSLEEAISVIESEGFSLVSPTKFVFLDTETTGVGPDAEMISIAIVDEEGNVMLDTYVTPIQAKEWPNAMAVNGITPEFIFSGNFPTATQLEGRISEAIENCTVVMYGADFDSRFISTPLYMTGSQTACCMARFSDYIGEFDFRRNAPKRHKLTKAAEIAGHQWIDTPHGALADAQATRAVWQFLDGEGHVQTDFYL